MQGVWGRGGQKQVDTVSGKDAQWSFIRQREDVAIHLDISAHCTLILTRISSPHLLLFLVQHISSFFLG